MPSFCLPPPENHKLINLESAGKNFRTADDSLQQLGCGGKVSFTSNRSSHRIFPPAFLQQFPPKIPNISCKLYTTYHSRHALTLLEKVNIIPVCGGESWWWIPELLSKTLTCSYMTAQHGFPRHSTQTAPPPNRNLNKSNLRITSTNSEPHSSHGTEKRYDGTVTNQSTETR